MKKVIINADDFGYTQGINKGIIEAITRGVVTSTSVMVYGQYARQSVELKNFKHISIGLHLELDDPSEEMLAEFQKQIGIFVDILGKEPEHIDLHKLKIKGHPELHSLLRSYSHKNKIPVRGLSARAVDSFFGWDKEGLKTLQQISSESLIAILDNLEDEISEIMCHIGYSDDELRKISSYNDLRELELATLTDSAVKEYFEEHKELKLISWNEV